MNIRIVRNIVLTLAMGASLALLPGKPAAAQTCSPACAACAVAAQEQASRCWSWCNNYGPCLDACMNAYMTQVTNNCLPLP